MTDPSYAAVTERLFRTFHAVHPLPVITAVLQRCRTDLTACRPGRCRNCWNGWPASG